MPLHYVELQHWLNVELCITIAAAQCKTTVIGCSVYNHVTFSLQVNEWTSDHDMSGCIAVATCRAHAHARRATSLQRVTSVSGHTRRFSAADQQVQQVVYFVDPTSTTCQMAMTSGQDWSYGHFGLYDVSCDHTSTRPLNTKNVM